jgi:hypothetical protein
MPSETGHHCARPEFGGHDEQGDPKLNPCSDILVATPMADPSGDQRPAAGKGLGMSVAPPSAPQQTTGSVVIASIGWNTLKVESAPTRAREGWAVRVPPDSRDVRRVQGNAAANFS